MGKNEFKNISKSIIINDSSEVNINTSENCDTEVTERDDLFETSLIGSVSQIGAVGLIALIADILAILEVIKSYTANGIFWISTIPGVIATVLVATVALLIYQCISVIPKLFTQGFVGRFIKDEKNIYWIKTKKCPICTGKLKCCTKSDNLYIVCTKNRNHSWKGDPTQIISK